MEFEKVDGPKWLDHLTFPFSLRSLNMESKHSPVWREEKKRNICVFLPFLNGWVGEKRKAKIEISFVFWLISLQEKRTVCYLEITLYVAYLFSFRLHLDGRLRYCKMFGFFSLQMFPTFGEIQKVRYKNLLSLLFSVFLFSYPNKWVRWLGRRAIHFFIFSLNGPIQMDCYFFLFFSRATK